MVERIFKAHDNLRKRGLTGDLGFGLVLGGLTSIVLHATGTVEGQIWGVPFAIIYGSVVAVGTTLISERIGRYISHEYDSE